MSLGKGPGNACGRIFFARAAAKARNVRVKRYQKSPALLEFVVWRAKTSTRHRARAHAARRNMHGKTAFGDPECHIMTLCECCWPRAGVVPNGQRIHRELARTLR